MRAEMELARRQRQLDRTRELAFFLRQNDMDWVPVARANRCWVKQGRDPWPLIQSCALANEK